MAVPFCQTLSPDEGLIFRITHRDNVPWILANGLNSQSSERKDPHFVNIGNPELIEARRRRGVPVPPGGTLADYIPFYFTPYTPMLLNIQTGYGGIQRLQSEEIVILISSLSRLTERGVRWLFTDRHAKLAAASFFDDLSRLADVVDFGLLRRRDYRRDPERPDKLERYQAEALAHRHVPVAALSRVACYTSAVANRILETCSEMKIALAITQQPDLFR